MGMYIVNERTKDALDWFYEHDNEWQNDIEASERREDEPKVRFIERVYKIYH